MNRPKYRTAHDLLCAYYADRKGDLPAERAFALLRSYALRRGHIDSEWLNSADMLLDSSILDVEDVAQNFLGLDLFIDDLTEFDRDAAAPVFGTASPETGSIKICLRAAEYPPLYRSTVMHEVAHMVLHAGKRTRTLCYSPRAPLRPPEEREADRFMSEALLPKSLLYLAIVMAGRPYGLQEGEAFLAANTKRGRFQWRKFYFPFFVNRLCLSRELVAVRMSQQQKFDESTFEYHLTYPLPNRWRKPSPSKSGSIFDGALPPRRPVVERLVECWVALVPRVLSEHCAFESFSRGTLVLTVDGSSHLYELKQLLLAGLERQMLLATKSIGLEKIIVIPRT